MATALTQMELQCVRHHVNEELLTATKCQAYGQQCKDQQLQAQIQSCAGKHQQRAEQLMQLLS